jgi:hypothetical protein
VTPGAKREAGDSDMKKAVKTRGEAVAQVLSGKRANGVVFVNKMMNTSHGKLMKDLKGQDGVAHSLRASCQEVREATRTRLVLHHHMMDVELLLTFSSPR